MQGTAIPRARVHVKQRCLWRDHDLLAFNKGIMSIGAFTYYPLLFRLAMSGLASIALLHTKRARSSWPARTRQPCLRRSCSGSHPLKNYHQNKACILCVSRWS